MYGTAKYLANMRNVLGRSNHHRKILATIYVAREIFRCAVYFGMSSGTLLLSQVSSHLESTPTYHQILCVILEITWMTQWANINYLVVTQYWDVRLSQIVQS